MLLIVIGVTLATTVMSVAIYRFFNQRRRLLSQGQINHAGQADTELQAMPFNPGHVVLSAIRATPEIVHNLRIYTYTGEAPTAVPIAPKEGVKEEVQHSVTELDAGTPPPSMNDGPEMTGIRRPEPVAINPATDEAAPSVNRHWDMQTSCAICLDEFVIGSPLRELPCGHVFDPLCIDQYLLEQNSLCPLCKKSVLPAGYASLR